MRLADSPLLSPLVTSRVVSRALTLSALTLSALTLSALTLSALTLCAGCDDVSSSAPDMAAPDMTPPPPAPRCGDGEVNQPLEACDDGNEDDSDGCLSSCALARCGDGVVQVGVEACDDGNEDDSDGCLSSCALARCGDGYTRADLALGEEGFEACDDGNDDDSDACLSSCALARCGDGVVQVGVEVCDDSNDDNFDGCLSSCQANICGDGYLNRGVEGCDDGNLTDEDACTSACALNVCGDGLLHRGVEGCDEGEANSDEGRCTRECARARCGDGLVRADLAAGEAGYEGCDDGNEEDRDACHSDCTPARCGDGVVRADVPLGHPEFEQCDPASRAPGAPACDDECVLIECGNGKVQAGEQCDPANPAPDAPACDDECVLVECGNGKVQAGEACDAGLSEALPDRCRPDCTQPRCGDHITDTRAGEACDEGPRGGDLCRASCVLKRCGDGIIDTYDDPEREDEACDDANRNESDACNSACQLHRCGDGVLRAGLAVGEAGFEACDWGAENSVAPDHCRPDCALPRCGDGVVDEGEVCDDGDDDEHNGCSSACEVSWCGDGALSAYLLSDGAPQGGCEGLSGCVEEECEPELLGGDLCDEGCTLRRYAISSGDHTHTYKIAPLGSEDLYELTLSAPSAIHLVARNSAGPSERCPERLYRPLTLERLGEGGRPVARVTPIAGGPSLGDVGVCGSLQADLAAGRYLLRVGGAGEARDRYHLRALLSQDISARGAFKTHLIPSGDPSAHDQGLMHLLISEADLEPNGAPRRARLIFHSASLPEGEVTAPCPLLSLTRAGALRSIFEVERPHASLPVPLRAVTGLRDQGTCAYEASLSAGLYQLSFDPAATVYGAMTYQWAERCGDALLDPGEGCDLGLRAEAFPCSRICQSDPQGTPNDGVCDPSEALVGASDCDLTCAEAQGGCSGRWDSALIDERVVQPTSDLKAYSFSVKDPLQLYASLSYCSAPLALELRSPSGALLARGEGGGRAGCASLDLSLSSGDYTLSVDVSGAQLAGVERASYWLEALKAQRISDRAPTPSALPPATGGGGATPPSVIPAAFELTLDQRENLELMVFDDDNTRQCESLRAYGFTLYQLTQEGRLKRDLSGAPTAAALVSAGPQYESGTAPLREEVPCALTALTLSAGRYVVGVSGEPEARFVVQALSPRRCGDGRLDPGEGCDDGNLSEGDGCTKYCVKEPRCGDGVLDRGEGCDDGNTEDGDLTCSSACTSCGDGQIQPWESCDDGNTLSGDGCDSLCSAEVVRVINAVTHHSGQLAQPLYETREGSEARALSEMSDVYLMRLWAESSVSALLCAPLLRGDVPSDEVMAQLRDHLSARARLVPLVGSTPALEQLSALPAPAALEGGALTVSALNTAPTLDLSVELNELVSCDGEPSPSGLTSLATGAQREAWAADERVACLKMTWPEVPASGEYALVVEATESWPLYRDHPIRYQLNLMSWRPLWTAATPTLGVLSGSMPGSGDALFKLSASALHQGSGEPEVYEARTLDQDHFSCPLGTSTALSALSGAGGACAVVSRLPEGAPCASTRLTLSPGGDYFFQLRPREPDEGLSAYNLKVRSVSACGDGALDMGEQCDDGNLNDLDACSKVCTYTYLLCGDRALDEGEQCDDGNTLDGDGCSARCLSERCVEVDGEEICRVWLLEAEGEVSLTPPEGTGALGGDRPRFSVVRYRPTLRNAVSHAYTLAQGELRLSGDIGDALTPVSLSSFTPSEPVVEGEDLMSYPIDLDAWAIGESFRYRVSYTLSASAQVFGRTLSLGSDLFELDLNELVPSEAFDVSGAAAPGAQVVLQVAVVDPEVLELANINDPPCADDLDTSLTLTRSAGDVLVESDDVSATNLCSALYTLIDYEPCDTRPAGDIEACRARNRYHIKVSNRSLKTTSYQLQITLPELLCGNGALDFGEECDVNAPAPCDARCRLVTESP